jgi:putative NADH-flavin reductase
MPSGFKKIAVLGGTGKAGQYLTRELIRQGFRVKALARDPGKMGISDPFLEVVPGNAREYESVVALFRECDAIISTLGSARDQPDTCSIAVGHIIKAMQSLNIHRYIEVAGLGINTPEDKKGFMTRILVSFMRLFASPAIDDRQKDYEMLRNSSVQWTIVRCPMIKLTDLNGKVITSLQDKPGIRISAADLARFLTGQLSDETFICKAPFIAST